MPDKAGGCSLPWFAERAGARLYNYSEGAAVAAFERVETDSRAVGPGALFVALRGERADGHDYLAQVQAAGAAAALVSEAWYASAGEAACLRLPLVVAPDPLAALQRAAAAWRASLPGIARIGITGSSGKTTVKEMCAAILSRVMRTVKNPGNLNSEIGLPASIFLMRPEHELAVFELGINRQGEMDILAEIFAPDCALITGIGTAHIGLLGGSRLGIASEKKRIASRFTGVQTLIVREDDEFKDFLMSDLAGRALGYGPRSMPLFEGARGLGLAGWSLRYGGLECRLALPGAHNLMNALAAIRAAELYGAGPEAVRDGLAELAALSGRSQVLPGPVTIVNDSYNANAESAVAALEFCDEAEHAGRRVYVLGSMKELGDHGPEAHRLVGRRAARSKAAAVFFFGQEAQDGYRAAAEAIAEAGAGPAIYHFVDYGELEAAVVAALRPGDAALLKASRSMALERLIEPIRKIGGGDAS